MAALVPWAFATPVPAQTRASAALHGVFERFDANRDGAIDPEEWARLARDQEDLPIEVDRDGRLTESEFAHTVGEARARSSVSARLSLGTFLVRGRKLLAEGKPEAAVPVLESAEVGAADYRASVALLAETLIRLGRIGEAEAKLVEAVTRVPTAAEFWLLLAAARKKAANQSGAESALSRVRSLLAFAVKIPTRNAPPGASLAPSGLQQNVQSAIAMAVVAFGPDSPAGKELSRLARTKSSGASQALSPEALFVCHEQDLVRRRQYERALADAELEVRAHPANWRARVISAALMVAQGRPKDGLARLETAVAQGAPADATSPLRARLLLDLGQRNQALASLPASDLPTCVLSEMFDIGWQLSARGEIRAAVPYLMRASIGWYEVNMSSLLLRYSHWKLTGAPFVLDSFAVPVPMALDELRLLLRLARSLDRVKQVLQIFRDAVARAPDAGSWHCLAQAQGLVADASGRRHSLEEARNLAPAGSPLLKQIEEELGGDGSGK